MCVCVYVCVHVLKERERRRELHSMDLELQPTLTKVGGPDKNILRAGCGPRAKGWRPLVYMVVIVRNTRILA